MTGAAGRSTLRATALGPVLALWFGVGCGGTDEGRSAEPATENTEAPAATAPAAPRAARSASAAAAGDVPMNLSVSVGGQTHGASGSGECRHADPASIYDMPSSMWTVRFRGAGPIERLHLTVWRPKSGGPDQLGLRLRTASGEHEIDTVAGDGETAGSAAVTIEPDGKGGRLAVEGRDADGVPIRATIDCARFDGVEAVGG